MNTLTFEGITITDVLLRCEPLAHSEGMCLCLLGSLDNLGNLGIGGCQNHSLRTPGQDTVGDILRPSTDDLGISVTLHLDVIADLHIILAEPDTAALVNTGFQKRLLIHGLLHQLKFLFDPAVDDLRSNRSTINLPFLLAVLNGE